MAYKETQPFPSSSTVLSTGAVTSCRIHHSSPQQYPDQVLFRRLADLADLMTMAALNAAAMCHNSNRNSLDACLGLLTPDETAAYSSFLTRIQTTARTDDARNASHATLSWALKQIPLPRAGSSSYGPLVVLGILLISIPPTSSWPVLELQLAHAQAWRSLPEEAKAGRGPAEARAWMDRVDGLCKSSYTSLLDLLPHKHTAAIIDAESGREISHARLAACVQEFALPLPTPPSMTKPVVAISLPNGPLLAMTVLATAAYYTAAPVAHGAAVGREQFKADVLLGGSSAVIASAADADRLGLRDAWLAEAGIRVFLVELSPDFSLVIRTLNGKELSSRSISAKTPNTPDDVGILLFTSGTSGTKKLVPLHVHSIISGAAQVVESWGLTSSSRCLNQMPLHHVGGLVRNLYSPILSGGSLIACSAFDAELFWDCVEDHAATWYYASPSMHQVILDVGSNRPAALAKSQIRLVCNAAGGLLPSLAVRIRDTFSHDNVHCTVLPSYGMTECMPISTPPLTYQLDRTGTSGITVGPDLAILDGNDQRLDPGVVGRISVRGLPVFKGYLRPGNVMDTSCFNANGWFDTGDMGYLDPEGYLYVTGRSKEVINRGGELVSPFEVEEALVAAAATPGSPIEGRVSRALAFSVPHDVLQEVVGVAVQTPTGGQRACLRSIQEAVRNRLAQPKVPVMVVFMDAGLPTNNGKVVRIRLADRLGLQSISDDTHEAERHYDADSPPLNAALSQSIACRRVEPDLDAVRRVCRMHLPQQVEAHVRPDRKGFYPELVLAPKVAQTPGEEPLADTQTLVATCWSSMPAYNVPRDIRQIHQPLPYTGANVIDDEAVDQVIASEAKASRKIQTSNAPMSKTEQKVATAFASVLDASPEQMDPESDFFTLGGDSMKAGRLLSVLRAEFSLRIPIDMLFTKSQIGSLSALIDERLGPASPTTSHNSSTTAFSFKKEERGTATCQWSRSSTNPVLLLLQLAPILIVSPLKRALTWFTFMYCLAYSQELVTTNTMGGRFVNLVVSLVIGKAVTKIVAPILAIAFKWIVIGRYREGLFPIWSLYHTRWWMTEKVLAIGGMGVFSFTATGRKLYLMLLGAKIGQNVRIANGVSMGEYDLIEIGDGATLERSTIRPFAAERNATMYLGRIVIGANSVVGLGSIVAAGTEVPAGACIGPNSSSWEAADADEANRDLAASNIPSAHWALDLFLTLPLQILTRFIGLIPWFLGILALVSSDGLTPSVDLLHQVIAWFARPYRVGWHYFALAANAALGPAFYFAAVLIVKKTLDLLCHGPIATGPGGSRSTFDTWRAQLIRTLLPAGAFHQLSVLFGTHYEATSILYRMLGAKVGKGVYWPGTGPSTQDYHLLDIGDNVVFGSRSHIVTSDGTGSDPVRVKAGAMIADRVVLLPGTTIGEGGVLGSGALTRRDATYPAGTTWVGSKRGEAVCLTRGTPRRVSFESEGESSDDEKVSMEREKNSMDKGKAAASTSVKSRHEATGSSSSSSSSPFARAFYHGQAPYRVWGQFTIFCYSTFITVLTATYWNVGSISAVQIIADMFRHDAAHLHDVTVKRAVVVYALFFGCIAIISALQTVVALAVVIGAKWVLLGRRRQGNYDWDKSPYCQRWQLFLALEALRRDCNGSQGILGLLTSTRWVVWYYKLMGATIGKDVAIFASGKPSLYFTEPDLLTIGDRVAVDDASLVAHVNTRGKFDLNPLVVGDRAVLRTGSRLLSGAGMEADSCLLEHTLIMAGDVVEAGCTRQGWPGEDFTKSRTPSL